MTTPNPFADRLAQAAAQGYLPAKREWASSSVVGRSAARRPVAPVADPVADGITARQRELVTSLLSERNLAAETRPAWNARLFDLVNDPEQVPALSKTAASALIEYLFGLPKFVPSTEAEENVPAGHYAVRTDIDTIAFLRVDKPETGKWAGRTFVSLQHGDDYTNMGRAAGKTMLAKIVAQGVMESSALYGKELGVCGVCHRTLTNEESRRVGIGPVCAEKFGL